MAWQAMYRDWQEEEPLTLTTKKAIKAHAREVAHNVCSWVELPEVGEVYWSSFDGRVTVQDRHDAADLWEQWCSESISMACTGGDASDDMAQLSHVSLYKDYDIYLFWLEESEKQIRREWRIRSRGFYD